MPVFSRLPIVILPSCSREIGGRNFLTTPSNYTDALRMVGCLPLLATAVNQAELDALFDFADGILLPGSPSNVHASYYDEEVLDPALPLDPQRDGFTLPMIRAAMERGIPLLGICRGHQEMNMALGGSLHQAVHRIPGFQNHQPGVNEAPEIRYGPAHEVEITADGFLERILGPGRIMVNSIHGQGIHRLAPGLRIEALSPDGVIEAIHSPSAPGFNLGVQWHPEWQAAGNPVFESIFRAFAEACRARRSPRIS